MESPNSSVSKAKTVLRLSPRLLVKLKLDSSSHGSRLAHSRTGGDNDTHFGADFVKTGGDGCGGSITSEHVAL